MKKRRCSIKNKKKAIYNEYCHNPPIIWFSILMSVWVCLCVCVYVCMCVCVYVCTANTPRKRTSHHVCVCAAPGPRQSIWKYYFASSHRTRKYFRWDFTWKESLPWHGPSSAELEAHCKHASFCQKVVPGFTRTCRPRSRQVRPTPWKSV